MITSRPSERAAAIFENPFKDIITALQKGEKFEKLAERSKDTGSKANGGDL